MWRRQRRQQHRQQHRRCRHHRSRQRPDLQLSADWQGLRLAQLPPRPLRMQSQIAIRNQPSFKVLVPQLQLSRGDARLTASGELWPSVRLSSGELRLGDELRASLGAVLGANPRLGASLQQIGGWSRPQFQLDLQQQANPLIGDWQARLRLPPAPS